MLLLCHFPGADPRFHVRGGALNKIAPSGGGAKMFGVFRVKIKILRKKKSYFFPILREGPRVPPPFGSAPAFNTDFIPKIDDLFAVVSHEDQSFI